jgi:hypothetical protein
MAERHCRGIDAGHFSRRPPAVCGTDAHAGVAPTDPTAPTDPIETARSRRRNRIRRERACVLTGRAGAIYFSEA